MNVQRTSGPAAGAFPGALLEAYGLACGYSIPTATQQGQAAEDGHRTELEEIVTGVLQNALALICALGAFALSLHALSIIGR